jgi:hypothetical protein
MKPTPPIWTIPLLLAILGIVLLVGGFGAIAKVLVSVETLAYCGYLILRARSAADAPRPVSNLIALFPGHLLLLLAISSLAAPDGLAYVWALVPPATVLYDLIAWRGLLRAEIRTSISAVLYAIIWADLFYLLERLIALTREWDERIIIVALGLVGCVFLGLGLYRHRLAAKE